MKKGRSFFHTKLLTVNMKKVNETVLKHEKVLVKLLLRRLKLKLTRNMKKVNAVLARASSVP